MKQHHAAMIGLVWVLCIVSLAYLSWSRYPDWVSGVALGCAASMLVDFISNAISLRKE